MTTEKHIPFETLADYVEGRLTAEAQAEVQVHLASGCPACAENAAFLKRMNTAARAAAWPVPPDRQHRKAVNALRAPDLAHPRSRPTWQRRLVPLALTVLAVAILLVVILQPGPAYAASLANISGKVEVRLAPTGAWQTVTAGQTLPVGAEIRTDADGQAELLLPGGDRIQLAPGTQIQLKQAVRSDGKWKVVLSQSAGGIESWVQSGSEGYSLQTSAGEVATNGAHFHVTIGAGDSTSVSVVDGEVSVHAAQGSATLRDGEETVFSPGSAPTTRSIPAATQETTPPPTENGQPPFLPVPGDTPQMEATPPMQPTMEGLPLPTPTD